MYGLGSQTGWLLTKYLYRYNTDDLDIETYYSDIKEYSKKKAQYAWFGLAFAFLSRTVKDGFDKSAIGAWGKIFFEEPTVCFPEDSTVL